MEKNARYIFFTDFDGTITLEDSNDFMTDNIGYGPELRRKGNIDVIEGRKSFRHDLTSSWHGRVAFKDMMDSIKRPFDECKDLVRRNITIDPHFASFVHWASEQGIPVVILTSGMEPLVSALLSDRLGPATTRSLQIIANNVQARDGKGINEEGGWEVVFHDESDYGHDKSLSIRPYSALSPAERPTLFYAGDGGSDLSAARETDLLFAKTGRDLVTYCLKEDIPLTVFNDWRDILERTKQIVSGTITVEEAAVEGYQAYKATLI